MVTLLTRGLLGPRANLFPLRVEIWVNSGNEIEGIWEFVPDYSTAKSPDATSNTRAGPAVASSR